MNKSWGLAILLDFVLFLLDTSINPVDYKKFHYRHGMFGVGQPFGLDLPNRDELHIYPRVVITTVFPLYDKCLRFYKNSVGFLSCMKGFITSVKGFSSHHNGLINQAYTFSPMSLYL